MRLKVLKSGRRCCEFYKLPDVTVLLIRLKHLSLRFKKIEYFQMLLKTNTFKCTDT